MTIQQMLLGGSGESGYNLTRSLRFRASASAYLSRTLTTPTNAKIWTYSGWVKKCRNADVQNLQYLFMSDNGEGVIRFSGDTIMAYDFNGVGFNWLLQTTAVFRDPSAWYHIVVSYDSTQATASNRAKIYVNGVQQTAFSTATYPTLNANSLINAAVSHKIASSSGTSNFLDCYLADQYFIDGQALTPASFGSTNALTGVWQPAPYTGTYGTNGFYLPFTDNSALTTSSNVGLGRDYSGNGNYWTTNNISLTSGVTYDSMTDVPTLTNATTANYCVANPLSNSTNVLSGGNLNIASASGNANTRCNSTIAVSSGKWYYEMTLTGVGTNSSAGIGQNQITNAYPANDALSYAYELDNARIGNNNSFSSYGSALGLNDVFMCAFDLDNNKIFFGKNGTWFNSSDPAAGTSPAYTLTAGTYCPIARPYNANLTGASFAANFGQRPFVYTPPTGFVALNAFNLPTATIVKGNTVMDATLYTGNGSTQTITNAGGFRPDLVWIKSRSNAYSNNLEDSVRGFGNVLTSNGTAAEYSGSANYGYVSAVSGSGFSVAVGSLGGQETNQSSATYVGWQWQAGQGSSSSNTAGSITSTVSVNASAGFSVVTFTGNGTAGATVGHGLGVAPSLIITKSRQYSGQSWFVYHRSITANNYLVLNTTDASTASVLAWNNTAPTSSVMTLGSANGTNFPSGTQVSYCWSEIDGFSKFGSYTGNGSSDGTFIYLGFRPRFVIFKRTDSAGGDWWIQDSARDLFNAELKYLRPQSSAAEQTSTQGGCDFLSNGIKLRDTGGYQGASGGTYIYAAFAENPFKNSLAR